MKISKSKEGKKAGNPKDSSTSLGVSILNKQPHSFKPCKLCKQEGCDLPDHSVSRCSKYPDSGDKVNKIIELHGCTRCSGLTHQKMNCTTKFQSRCGNCKKWHFEILCEGKSVPKPMANKSPLQEKEKKIKEKAVGNDVENGLT